MAESFSHNANQKIIKAAKIVLNSSDFGGGNNGAGANTNQCITAKLNTKDDTDPVYTSWVQERRTVSGWESVSNALTDKDGAYPAYSLDETSTIDLTGTHVVLLRVKIGSEDSGSSKEWAWIVIDTSGGIKDIRLSGDGTSVQVTYDGVIWIDKIAVGDCTSSGSSASSEGE